MLNIIILIVSILFFSIGIYLFHHTHKINKQVESENEQLQLKNFNLQNHYNQLLEDCTELNNNIEKAQNNLYMSCTSN